MEYSGARRAGEIIVGVDPRDDWQRALDWAVDQAAVEGRALTIVHAVEASEELWHDAHGHDNRIGVEERAAPTQLLVDRARERALTRAPGLTVHESLHRGSPRSVLTAAATGAHLLVIGARRHRGPWARVFGTVGTAVTRHPSCPVVVVRTDHPGRVHNGVLVGVDETEHSQAALRFAYRQASLHRWPLTALHVAPDPIPDYGPDAHVQEQLQLAEAVAGSAEEFPDVPAATRVVFGEPAGCLLRAGMSMNLIVLGAHHGATMSDVLLGSVVVPVVERARCAVAVVPAAWA